MQVIDQEQTAGVLQFFGKFAAPGRDLMSSYSVSAAHRMDPCWDLKKSALNFKQNNSGGTERNKKAKVAAGFFLRLGRRAVPQAVGILRRQFSVSLKSLFPCRGCVPAVSWCVFMDTNRADSPWFPRQALRGDRGHLWHTRRSLRPLSNAAEGASGELQDNSSETMNDFSHWGLTSASCSGTFTSAGAGTLWHSNSSQRAVAQPSFGKRVGIPFLGTAL